MVEAETLGNDAPLEERVDERGLQPPDDLTRQAIVRPAQTDQADQVERRQPKRENGGRQHKGEYDMFRV